MSKSSLSAAATAPRTTAGAAAPSSAAATAPRSASTTAAAVDAAASAGQQGSADDDVCNASNNGSLCCGKCGVTCCTVLVVLGIIAVIALPATSIKKLDAHDQAVMYDVVGKRFQGVYGQGLHTGVPGFDWVRYSSVFESVKLNHSCLTTDGLDVNLVTTFQFVANNKDLINITLRFGNQDGFAKVVNTAATAAVVGVCSSFNISEFQGGRPVIQSKIDEAIRASLKELQADALGAQLVDVTTPPPWNAATSDKQRAQQDIDFALNERSQKVYQAQNNVALATQDAKITNQTAATNASIVLTTAKQEAAAIAKEYASFGSVVTGMMATYDVDFAGLVVFLQNSLVRSSQEVDLVMPDTPTSSKP